jgi:hypothetical protein
MGAERSGDAMGAVFIPGFHRELGQQRRVRVIAVLKLKFDPELSGEINQTAGVSCLLATVAKRHGGIGGELSAHTHPMSSFINVVCMECLSVGA